MGNTTRNSECSSNPVQGFYRFHAPIYDLTRWMFLFRRKAAVRAMEIEPHHRILEVGCGTGLNFANVATQLDPTRGGKLVGLDFSEAMLARARQRVASSGWRHVSCVQADASKMQLSEQFDRIFFSYSIAMIPDWRAALDRAAEHLDPNGRVVVLEFGRFEHWPLVGGLCRGWLRLNHVDVMQPYVEAMRERFAHVHVEQWLGGYAFVARANN
ncbi:MAG: methyltransferase domain-containing protein [Phycisphaerales bacterium]|nr:methyltransferase domain-containing protein [Phycisphaerales bacterium]MCB9862647.1 methyltransferase domain-containing protein [Phycisphaerales bacterium]